MTAVAFDLTYVTLAAVYAAASMMRRLPKGMDLYCKIYAAFSMVSQAIVTIAVLLTKSPQIDAFRHLINFCAMGIILYHLTASFYSVRHAVVKKLKVVTTMASEMRDGMRERPANSVDKSTGTGVAGLRWTATSKSSGQNESARSYNHRHSTTTYTKENFKRDVSTTPKRPGGGAAVSSGEAESKAALHANHVLENSQGALLVVNPVGEGVLVESNAVPLPIKSVLYKPPFGDGEGDDNTKSQGGQSIGPSPKQSWRKKSKRQRNDSDVIGHYKRPAVAIRAFTALRNRLTRFIILVPLIAGLACIVLAILFFRSLTQREDVARAADRESTSDYSSISDLRFFVPIFIIAFYQQYAFVRMPFCCRYRQK
eukprot:CAMPEP_0185271474 /NCGR_PEP_ID=MMETSP1359-20130426/44880_1 /TAXON_ID=552665 /ORGANISM="Bigelowiella longifila, Strain CCMP242" /LENGTH=368 /DNA_ID=CAMNT_0027863437 /DNA_START=59 /DNA_END=1165 /DNA_ORIENTATION=-